jgi:hypothetical protein
VPPPELAAALLPDVTVIVTVDVSVTPLISVTSNWNRSIVSELTVGATKVAVEVSALDKVTVPPMVCDQA